MAIIKIDNLALLLQNTNNSSVVYTGAKISTLRSKGVNYHPISNSRTLIASYFQIASDRWLTLSEVDKDYWAEARFVYLPYSPTWDAPPLLAHQFYIQRNIYQQILRTTQPEFLDNSDFEPRTGDYANRNLFILDKHLFLSLAWMINDGLCDNIISLSHPVSPSLESQMSTYHPYLGDDTRILLKVSNVDATIDITEKYQKVFGATPSAGSSIIFSVIQYNKVGPEILWSGCYMQIVT